MKTSKLLLLFTILVCIGAQSQTIAEEPKAKKIVFVIVDGISSDQLKKANTPYLDEIGLNGGYSDAYVGGGKNTYSETPTISAVGYNSLITGTWANKHNVWGNNIKNPNYNYPSIFRLFKNQYPNGTIGVFSSWLDNRTKLVGEGLAETNHLEVDYHFDGLELDSINYPHDQERNFMKLIDYTVADQAANTILDHAPDLSWVYLQFTDDMGHRYGDSERFNAAIEFEDQMVGKIWKAIKRRQDSHNEDWLLIVTTDHGRKVEDGKGHGGQTDRERSTWIVTNSKLTNSYFKDFTPAVVDILPTMVDFLNIDPSTEVEKEFDGVSLINPVDILNLKAQKKGRKLIVTWDNLSNGRGNLFISHTNKFKQGGKDRYELLGSFSLDKEMAVIPLRKVSDGFFKLVLETPNTVLNTWYTLE